MDSRQQTFFNINKCFAITYSKKFENINYNYCINSVYLERKTETKDLGILFENKLNFNKHIESQITNCYKLLGFLIRTSKDFRDVDTLKTLFNAMIRTKLEYGALIWNPIYTYQIKNIEFIQKKFLKYCYWKQREEKYEGSYDNLLEFFKMVPLEKRRNECDMMFLYKIINHVVDDPNLLQEININVPNFNTRKILTFRCKNVKTNYHLNSPLIRICTNFNKITQDLDIFNLKINSFKNSIRRLL